MDWEGKLLPDLTGKNLVDHLPTILTGVGVSQLLFFFYTSGCVKKISPGGIGKQA